MKLHYGRLIKRSGRRAWYWHYYAEDGKNRTISTGTEDHKEAEKIARKWAAEHIAERENLIESHTPSGTPLIIAINEYVEKKVPDLSPRYQPDVLRHLDRIESYFGEDTPINSIDHKMIDAFPDYLREQNPQIKPQTINAYLSTFSKLMKLACRYGYRESMPYLEREEGIRRKHGEVYSPDQIMRILQAAREIDQEKQDIDECCIRFVGLGLFCGLRHSEAVSAQWELLDFEKNIGFLLTQKNKSAMPFPLGMLGQYLSKVPDARRVGEIVQYKHNQYSTDRRPVKFLHKTWRDIRARAELKPDAKFHSLRNTFVQRHFDRYGYSTKNLSRHKSTQAMFIYLQEKNMELLSSQENVFGEEVAGLLGMD